MTYLYATGDRKKAQNDLDESLPRAIFPLTAPKLAYTAVLTFKDLLMSMEVIHLHVQSPRITSKNVKGSREVKQTDTIPH